MAPEKHGDDPDDIKQIAQDKKHKEAIKRKDLQDSDEEKESYKKAKTNVPPKKGKTTFYQLLGDLIEEEGTTGAGFHKTVTKLRDTIDENKSKAFNEMAKKISNAAEEKMGTNKVRHSYITSPKKKPVLNLIDSEDDVLNFDPFKTSPTSNVTSTSSSASPSPPREKTTPPRGKTPSPPREKTTPPREKTPPRQEKTPSPPRGDKIQTPTPIRSPSPTPEITLDGKAKVAISAQIAGISTAADARGTDLILSFLRENGTTSDLAKIVVDDHGVAYLEFKLKITLNY